MEAAEDDVERLRTFANHERLARFVIQRVDNLAAWQGPGNAAEAELDQLIARQIQLNEAYFATLDPSSADYQLERLTHILYPREEETMDFWYRVVTIAPALTFYGVSELAEHHSIEAETYMTLLSGWSNLANSKLRPLYMQIVRRAYATGRPLCNHITRDLNNMFAADSAFIEWYTQVLQICLPRHREEIVEQVQEVASIWLDQFNDNRAMRNFGFRLNSLTGGLILDKTTEEFQREWRDLQRIVRATDALESLLRRARGTEAPFAALPPRGAFPGGPEYHKSRLEFAARGGGDIRSRIAALRSDDVDEIERILGELQITQEFESGEDAIRYLRDYASQL